MRRQEAFEVAAEVGARMSQLRAATKLARKRGKRSDAAAIVRTVYELFTEGFETPDLVRLAPSSPAWKPDRTPEPDVVPRAIRSMCSS